MDENDEFNAEHNETINSTVAGSGFYMSPEMKGELPNGTKTDIWSLGVTIGVLLGLDEMCPPGFKGGVPGFIKSCASNKNDMYLAKANFYISPILKDLLKNMLIVDVKKRFNMQQVMDHRYITLSQEKYEEGYNEWSATEIPRLHALIKQEESILSKVNPEYRRLFKNLSD